MEYGGLSESVGEEEMIEDLLVDGCWVETGNSTSEVGNKRWWIGPIRANPGPSSSSVRDRLAVAVAYLKEYTKNNNNNVLIQIWVPLRRSSEGLALDYHTNPDHDSDSSFLSVPFPINPNHNHNLNFHLRFFRCHDYPRLPYNDLPDSMAFPVFERGTAACLGLLHIQTIINYHYHSQLVIDHNNLSNAFEAVDLIRSCENFIPPAVKVFEELYEAAVNEIAEVMTCACKTHNLPLALTWAPCIQQKCGYGHSTDNYVSIVDSACYVGDVAILGFQEACSDCHLLRGQGIVGTAFTTSKPCFAIDITAFSKAEYPLAHHANMFGLHAAVAIPLRSVYTAVPADFVLEFFLPKDSTHDHKHILNSLSFLLQQACRTLHVVMDVDDEFTLQPPPPPPPQVEPSSSSWISHMMEAQQKGKGTVCVSLECLQEEPKEEFKVTTNWDQRRVGGDHQDSHTLVGRRSSSCSGGRKGGDQKRRTKAEKTISLQVLRQYFAGSLKDAAKSIGVCPTTLKRICRQHGITRWPSRKIKKVGHSLKKLQLVIDSVQGADGAIQIGSFYSSFPELSSATATATAESSKSKKSDLKSPHSSSASTIINPAASASDVLISESPVLRSEAELHASPTIQIQQEEDTKLFAPPILSDIASAWNSRALRVKATFADEKIRFSLQPFWGFRDLQLEIARRFNLNDMSNIVLKYLDDEGEWIVLACDGDLEECKDFHKSSQSRTIRLALFQASPLSLSNTFCNTSPS